MFQRHRPEMKITGGQQSCRAYICQSFSQVSKCQEYARSRILASVRKVPSGTAQAATPPSWKIFKRTSTLKGSIHLPLYSTCGPLAPATSCCLSAGCWGASSVYHFPANALVLLFHTLTAPNQALLQAQGTQLSAEMQNERYRCSLSE